MLQTAETRETERTSYMERASVVCQPLWEGFLGVQIMQSPLQIHMGDCPSRGL